MASDAELDTRQHNGVAASPDEPSTPQETGPQPTASQVTLPSTEVPESPLEPNQSFKTEANDDRTATMVIPSSLTPPPSTQVAAHSNAGRSFPRPQPSVLCSPPATILNTVRDRELGNDYVPPHSHQVSEASPDELRSMLQACIAEQQKLKMETAHHKLQYNLLSLQAEDDAKRAAVEHDMIRREVDALRTAEHSRQARRELSTASESTQAKYLLLKTQYEAAMDENATLYRRLQAAKTVIRQQEDETIGLAEERDLLLTRIRENREHFHMLCGPGGIFHSALATKQHAIATPQQHRVHQGVQHHTPQSSQQHHEADGREHGLSALLQAMSQSQDNNNNTNNNNSAPSTPMTSHRTVQRHSGRHNRSGQPMSSLPTTPVSRSHESGLLPSADLVPQTEPRQRYSQHEVVPTTPTPKRDRRRKSRESTISADENNEELARQAVESVEALHSFASHASKYASQGSMRQQHEAEVDDDDEVSGSQASQAATEMLRRHPGRSFEVSSSALRDGSPGPLEKSAKLQAKLLSSIRGSVIDKRKLSGNADSADDVRQEHGSPPKKMRTGGTFTDERQVGLGIQHSE